ncbi:MAG: HDIG domain-containing protein [Treponema sp.]|nr:HDIG domain-containing protein [Treponema sp.]
MKKNEKIALVDLFPYIRKAFIDAGVHRYPVIVAIAAFAISVLAIINSTDAPLGNLNRADDTVAERSVFAEKPLVFIVGQGERIVKKGFLVSEEDMAILTESKMESPVRDVPNMVGRVFVLVMLFMLFGFLSNPRFIGKNLSDSELYLIITLTALYVVGAAFAKNLPFNTISFPISIVMPTAFITMLLSVLISANLAVSWALALPLAAFLTGSFDISAYIVALASGLTASNTLRNAQWRMDLVKAGLFIAAANCASTICVLLLRRTSAFDYPLVLFWTAFNGIASGMLVMWLLPPLEQALNAVTTFRLMELSDLNAPIIKKLFTAAPGTYNHSVMVARLAEAACEEIGANFLLARVGGYYHDIGKIDHPEYFTENQSGYNKHDEIPPRLSATILRSHVKLGIERSRSMHLPKPVIDIIAQHHGTSLIQWFYNKALEQEQDVSREDFSYPGPPPRSRESAVVMLADVSEAAVRSRYTNANSEKPNAAKIEKSVQELIDMKIEHGQLAESELTFQDLETIKKAFVKVLMSYYHSRIEYPKEKLPPQGHSIPSHA